jgi:type I restriction enzyme S subunit
MPEYLNMFVKRDEFARMCRFLGCGSAREYCRVGDLQAININLPDIETQCRFVSVYKALLANQRAYEKGLEDLKLTCDAYIDQFKKTAPRVAMGDLLKEIDNRNRDESITNVQGININKVFMNSVANLDDTDLSKYKIISKGQFAYSAMQTGRDECIRIALYSEKEPCVISPAYSVLEVKSENILSEYLMLWFMRKESDRYGWFISDSSVRASLELQRFYEVEVPVPPIATQQCIVDIYNTYTQRREINERLKQQIKEVCPVLIRGSISLGGRDKGVDNLIIKN